MLDYTFFNYIKYIHKYIKHLHLWHIIERRLCYYNNLYLAIDP